MPNALTSAGLTTATRQELIDYFTQQFQIIYGSDVNIESDTPDGQWINIMVQAILDMQDLTAQVYASFDPDQAIGNTLDQRISINGIQRQAGTYTVTPITLVNTQSVTLYGVDQKNNADAQDVYTVSDNAGNLWELQDSQLGLSAGSHVLSFQAAEPGANLTIPNTITTPVTIVVGVSSVNNPTAYTSLGINEETDAQVKIRRAQSVSLASQGYLAGLLAALRNINGITSAFVYENTTSDTDSDGVPGHSIWVIVSGTAAAAEIAQAIYTKRNAGCGMYGQETYAVTTPDGSPFIVRWDEVITRNLFIKFTVTSIDGIIPPAVQAIREGLVESYIPTVNESLDINGVATAVQVIDPNTLVTNCGLSDGITQILNLSLIATSGAFVLSYNGANSASINWNDSIGTIQSKVQAITGLSAAIVTGSISSKVLTISLVNLSNVLGLVHVTTNTLVASAVPITFSYDYGYVNLLDSPTKQNQFVLSEDNIVITPMQLIPVSDQIGTGDEITFQAYGGYGAYVYSLSVNASGATINSSTGHYTAGVTPGSDTVKATDSLGNTITSLVVVT